MIVAKLGGQFVGGFQNRRARFFLWRDRENDNVRRRDPRRQDQAVVVGVRHDQRADQARAHAPARRPAKFLLAVARLKLNSARARKVLPEEMRRAGLDRFSILHHRFDAKCLHRARETVRSPISRR